MGRIYICIQTVCTSKGFLKKIKKKKKKNDNDVGALLLRNIFKDHSQEVYSTM